LQLEIGRFLVGMAAASGFLCCGKAASYYPDQSKYGLIVGLANVSGMVGGAFGSVLLVPLVSSIGWRYATCFVALIGILLLILSILCIKGEKVTKAEHRKGRSIKCLKVIVTKPQIWLVGMYGFMSELPITAIAELWGVQFAVHRFEISEKMASISSTAMFVAFGLGSIIAGFFADKVRKFKGMMMLSAIGMATSFAASVYIDDIGFWTFVALLFITGFFGGWNILCFSVIFRFVSKEFGATVTGFMNMVIMSSGLVAQPILGGLLDFFRNGLVTESGEPIYNLIMYRSSFVFVVFCMIIAIIIPLFIKEDNSHNPQTV
jgi:MFS family permease